MAELRVSGFVVGVLRWASREPQKQLRTECVATWVLPWLLLLLPPLASATSMAWDWIAQQRRGRGRHAVRGRAAVNAGAPRSQAPGAGACAGVSQHLATGLGTWLVYRTSG